MLLVCAGWGKSGLSPNRRGELRPLVRLTVEMHWVQYFAPRLSCYSHNHFYVRSVTYITPCSSSYKGLYVIKKLWWIIPEVTGQFALQHLLGFLTLTITQFDKENCTRDWYRLFDLSLVSLWQLYCIRLFVMWCMWKNFVIWKTFYRLHYYFAHRPLSQLKFYVADSANID